VPFAHFPLALLDLGWRWVAIFWCVIGPTALREIVTLSQLSHVLNRATKSGRDFNVRPPLVPQPRQFLNVIDAVSHA
jgi:hypothetical protein